MITRKYCCACLRAHVKVSKEEREETQYMPTALFPSRMRRSRATMKEIQEFGKANLEDGTGKGAA
jgi:hypothetical protein